METPKNKSLAEAAKEAHDSLGDLYMKLKEKVDFSDYPEFDNQCEYIKGLLFELSEVTFMNVQIIEDKITTVQQALKATTHNLYAYLRKKRIIVKSKESFDPEVLGLAEKFGKLSSLFDDIELQNREPQNSGPRLQEPEELPEDHEEVARGLKAVIFKYKLALIFIAFSYTCAAGVATCVAWDRLENLKKEKHKIERKLEKSEYKRELCAGRQSEATKVTSNLRKRVMLLEEREWEKIKDKTKKKLKK